VREREKERRRKEREKGEKEERKGQRGRKENQRPRLVKVGRISISHSIFKQSIPHSNNAGTRAPTRCSVTRMGTRLHTPAAVHVHAVASRIKGVPVLLVGGESCVIVIVAPAPAEATTEISLDVL